jgi:hypothetical protein
MSGAEKVAEYEISANPAGFTAGMEKAQAAAAQAAQDIKSSMSAIESHMGAVSGAVKSLTSVFGTLTAVVAGGAAFKEIIGKSNEWTGEAKKLSAQMGITTERASVMMVAMRHLGIDTEVVTMAAGKMAKQIATNGQAFEKLGVSVKDSAGQYRPTLDIMGEVNNKLKEIKNPIEQNIAGTQIYGRSWNEVRGTLRLTTEEIKAAEQKAKDFGLVVGDEGVANAKKYKESINDMKLIMTSLEVQAGNAVLPTFVKLGSWLSVVGPTAGKAFGMVLESVVEIISTVAEVVLDLWNTCREGFSLINDLVSDVMGRKAPGAFEIFGNMLKVIEVAFLGFKVAVQLVIEAIKGYIELLVTNIMRMATTADRALHGDFAGAKQAWATGTAILEDVQRKHFDNMIKIASDGKEKLDSIVLRGPSKGPEIKDKEIKGGPTYDFGKGDKDEKAKSRVHEWDAKLAADKDGYAKEQAMAGTAMEYSMSMERDFWKRILDTAAMTKEEKAQVERKYYASMAAIRKEDFDNEIAGEKLKLESFKNNHLERLEIANRIYQENVDRFGAEAKESKAALAEVYKEQRAFADQTMAVNRVVAEARRNAELAGIDAAQQDAEQQLALRQITIAQMLSLEAGFEAKRYQIRMQALIEQEALMHGPDQDPIALQQIHAQIEAAEQQHQAKMTAIKKKSTLEQNKSVQGLYTNMQSGLASVIANTAKGTMTMSQALQSMMQTVTGSVIDMLAQSAAQWLMNLILTETGSKTAAVSEITANAGIAGSAATASAAAIPLIGWAMAPEAGLAASAAAMAFMPMASASGGYDIPAGLNPIVQAHAEEMILPAKHANVIRDMADGGAAGGGGNTINYHDHSGRLSPAELRRNASVIAKVLQDHAKKS